MTNFLNTSQCFRPNCDEIDKASRNCGSREVRWSCLPLACPIDLDHDDRARPSFQRQPWSVYPFVPGPRCLLFWVHPYLRQRNFFSCSTLIYCHKSNKCIPTSIIGGKNTIFMQRLSFLLQYRQIYCNARNYLMQHNKFVAISFTTRNHFEFCANNPYLLQQK